MSRKPIEPITPEGAAALKAFGEVYRHAMVTSGICIDQSVANKAWNAAAKVIVNAVLEHPEDYEYVTD